MRIEGKLTRWEGAQGFGFITPDLGGPDVFIHISAFPRGGSKPRLGERLAFEIALDDKGRKRASKVERLRLVVAKPAEQREESTGRRGGWRRFLIPLALFGAGYATFGVPWSPFGSRPAQEAVVPAAELPPVVIPVPAPTPAFTCDGRTRCTQMRSCEEATFFLQHCPGTEMDGDRDGIPCEQQHC